MEQLKRFTLSSDIQKRVLLSTVLAPLVVLVVVAGGVLYDFVVVIAAILMSFEWNDVTSKKTLDEKEKRTWKIRGVLYVSVFAVSMLYLRSLPDERGAGVVLFVLFLVWAVDIAAYFSGRFIGGPKIAPSISPNKTWAGLIGGMLAAGAVGAFASVVMGGMDIVSLVLLSVVLAIVEQAGDFFESWVKRQFSVKDSSQLLPGHGGLMDRLDGLVAVAPAVVIITLLRGGQLF